MYKQHFGFKELPFSIAPDPRFLYMSEQHREALAHLVYGMNADGGFVLLTGEVGTGKTTVCRCMLEQIPESADISFILNPKMTVGELLATFCDELGIVYPEGNQSVKVFVDRINAYLLDAHARGRKTILIIEEAQNLGPDVLEQIRLLTNLETNRQKLLQIIMIGQPELKEILSRPELRQLSQRITARYHICPLTKSEVGAYVGYRLSVAGSKSKLFPDSIIGKLYQMSFGIPRLINVICDRALLGAYVQGKDTVDKKTLVKAAQEVFGERDIYKRPRKALTWVLTCIVLVICGVAVASTYYNYKSTVKASGILGPKVSTSEIRKSDNLQWPVSRQVAKREIDDSLFLWRIPKIYEAAVRPRYEGQDGVLGPQNLIRLNDVSSKDEPLLMKKLKDK